MAKLVVFCGSPRKKGYTQNILKEVIRGAESVDAEIITYDLNSTDIKGCQGCFYCRSHDTCIIKDDLAPMYDDIKSADAVLFGSPIYFYQITGQAKLWLDRMYPFIGPGHVPRFPGKKAMTVFAQGNKDINRYDYVRQDMDRCFQEAFGWDVIDSFIHIGESQDFSVPPEVLARAFEAGKNLVS